MKSLTPSGYKLCLHTPKEFKTKQTKQKKSVLSKCGKRKKKNQVCFYWISISMKAREIYAITNMKAGSNYILAYIIPIYCTS